MTAGASLAKAIAEVQAGFSVGARFAEVVEGARGELTRLAREIGEDSGLSDGAADVGHLEDLASRYTMQMERDVHQAAVGGTAATTVRDVDAAQGDPGPEMEMVLSSGAGEDAGSDAELGGQH